MKQSSKIIIDQDKLAKKRTYHIIKRIFDFIASLCGLIILSPLFLVVALLIKFEDNGPVFYKQKRVGKGQREFDMFKFRSMHADADKRLAELKKQNEVDGPMFKMKMILVLQRSAILSVRQVLMNCPNCSMSSVVI